MSDLGNLRDKTRQFVHALEEADLPPLESLSPTDARQLAEKLRRPQPERPVASVQNLNASGVPVRTYCDGDPPRASIVYFHGGGWVLGGLDESDGLMRDFAVETGYRVISVDYRLAPEAPFPAAVEDAVSAVAWAAAEYPQEPLFVMGESAGGNLAAVVSQKARENGGPAISGQVLIYPVTDGKMRTSSYSHYRQGPLLTADLMKWFFAQYLPEGISRSDPLVSPINGDLAGLPAALVMVAEHDVLRDEGEAYAAALKVAGVTVKLRRFEGQIHTFLALGLAEVDDDVIGEIERFIDDRIKASD